ncbi:hypothetical protein GCM10027290_58080 [Micromonospora sonneratiae]|jgi:hypothetical protein|uniref:Uncharacterized protein n=1 Tax=Micromonospora sonneratiae TaxID=1184706 RepID=A0ABW3YKR5_9ACTN
MVGEAGTGATREILMVFGLALAGIFLALIAVFAPWYGESVSPERPVVVEMHAPDRPPVPASPPARAGATLPGTR